MREAKITIKNKDDFNETEIILYGESWTEGETQFLVYVDKSQEDKTNKTVIAFDDNSLSYQKYGKYNMELNFEINNKLNFPLETEYGTMAVELSTKKLVIERTEKGANIDIDYTLIFSETQGVNYSINIEFKYVLSKEMI